MSVPCLLPQLLAYSALQKAAGGWRDGAEPLVPILINSQAGILHKHLPQVVDGPQGRQQRMCRVASHASLAQEHCQAWDDAVQHVLLSLQNTIGSVTPSPEFGDFCEKHWHYSYPTL